MRGWIAARAEIARREDDWLAEVVGPDPVDEDARGERVVGRNDRLRQLETTASVGKWLTLAAGHDRGHLARDMSAGVIRITPEKDNWLGWSRGIGKYHRSGRSSR